jgi:membrane protein DedA with SNARE-associated domain
MDAKSKELSLLISGLVLMTVATAIGIALSPALLSSHPLVLVGLSPIDQHLILAGRVTPVGAFVAVVSLRRMFGAAIGFRIGNKHGWRGLRWSRERYPKLRVVGPLARKLRRAFFLLALLTPWPAVCGMVAGIARISAWKFFTFATAMQAVWAWGFYEASVALGSWIAPFADFLRDNVEWATAACLLLVAVIAWSSRRSRKAEAAKPKAPPSEPATEQV